MTASWQSHGRVWLCRCVDTIVVRACPSRCCPRLLHYIGSSRHEASAHGGAVTGRCWSCAVCTVSCGTFRHTRTVARHGGVHGYYQLGIGCASETLVAGCNTLVCRAWSSGSLWSMNVPYTVVLCGIGHHRDRAWPEHHEHHGYALLTRHPWGLDGGSSYRFTCVCALVRMHAGAADSGAGAGAGARTHLSEA